MAGTNQNHTEKSLEKDLVSLITSHIDVNRLEKLLAQARLKHRRATVKFASAAHDAGLIEKTILTRIPFGDDYWILYVDSEGDVTCTKAIDMTLD